jgi:hypothetical protein
MSDRASTASTDPSRSGMDQAIVVPDLPDLGDIDEKPVAQRLAMAFATFMVGQTLTSENDYPYDPFWIEMDRRTPLTRETFCERMGLPLSDDMLWGPATPMPPPTEGGYDAALAYALFNTLLISMRAVLGNLTEVLARAENVVQVPYFLFGRLETGALVGVRSISIET